MAAKKSSKPGWYRIDNAGVLYSALQSDTYSAVYRFSAVMTEPVDPVALQRAIDKTMPRFPSFNVRIRKGLFWYYFEPEQRPGPFVQPDINNPCMPIRFYDNDSRLIRFYYYNHRISLECFHAVSDGVGSMTFFKTLLAVYLGELGHPIPCEKGVLDVNDPPRREELEDSYLKYATVKPIRGKWEKTAYPAEGTPEEFYTLNVTMGLVPLDQLRDKAHSYGVSVTEYLTAAYIHVLLERQKLTHPHTPKPVALVVPIDLRGWFPSETLRNFILTVRPSIDPAFGEYSFPEIVSQVHHYMRMNICRQSMQGRFVANVNFIRHPVLKFVPAVIKDMAMSLSYKMVGVRPYSSTYTNPGAFKVPKEMEPHIKRMEVMLGQPFGSRVNCASISYGNQMAITFAGTIRESDIEGGFFRFLVKEGLPVRVESNRPY
ncbi:MAG: hypothetical protein RR949_01565 [Oscillospiraceae bacterium]